jgi:hypothetical protein
MGGMRPGLISVSAGRDMEIGCEFLDFHCTVDPTSRTILYFVVGRAIRDVLPFYPAFFATHEEHADAGQHSTLIGRPAPSGINHLRSRRICGRVQSETSTRHYHTVH